MIFGTKKPHPEYKKLINKAFTLRGVDYYEFTNLLDMPKLRFQSEGRFLSELEIKIDYKTLIDTLTKSMQQLDKGFISKSIVLQNNLVEIANTKIGFDAIYKLASCHYFFIDENLDYYDYDIGDEKIEIFKAEKLSSFFLNEPIRQFLPQTDISENDLGTYYAYEKELKKHHLKTMTSMK